MNARLARLALTICWLSACSGRTLVGEVHKDGGSADVGGTVEVGPLDQGEVDGIAGGSQQGSAGARGELPQQGGAGAVAGASPQGGAGDKRFATLILQPGPGVGQDTSVMLLGTNPSPGRSDVAQLSAQTTTIDSVPLVRRSLLRFALPRMFGAQDIIKAQLSLWHDPDFVSHTVGTRWRLGRSASAWDQQSVSWLSQPAIAADAIEPPPPASSGTDYVIDVTDLVRGALAEGKEPDFTLRLVDEETLGQQVIFCSSEHTDAPCRPTLYIELMLANL